MFIVLEWMHTLSLLGLVTGDSADDRVLVPLDAVNGAFDVAFGLRGVVLCLACGVFFSAGLLPGGRTG
jgi:hypothetical protein